MASIGNRNKDMKEKEEIKWTEDTIQKVLRYGFLSPNSIKYVMENLTVYKWESDTLLVTKSGYAYEIEIKISRADFRNDFKHKEKKHLFLEGKGMKDALGTEYDDRWRPNYFYYAVPEGLISPDEVPDYAGLIYIHPLSSWPHFRVDNVKAATQLHKTKFDAERLGLMDKFYYNYRNWKQSFESKLEDYKHLLDEAMSFDGKKFGMTLPQAAEEIHMLENRLEDKEKHIASLEKDIRDLILENRALKGILKDNGIAITEEKTDHIVSF